MSETKADPLLVNYYRNPDLVRFLLIENLALKMLLHDSKLIKAEDFAQYQRAAAEVLDAKVAAQMEEWKKANPETVRLLEETVAMQQFMEQDQRPGQEPRPAEEPAAA